MATWDWDYRYANWHLDAVRYITAPSSIGSTSSAQNSILSRLAGAQNLPIGGLDSWLYRHGEWWAQPRIGFTFRNQNPLGASHINNSYLVSFSDRPEAFLWRRVGAVMNYIGEWVADWQVTTWKRYMVTWWNGYNEQNHPALVVRLQEWDGAQWVDRGELYDTNNEWAESPINRCGIVLGQVMNNADDTVIWQPLDP